MLGDIYKGELEHVVHLKKNFSGRVDAGCGRKEEWVNSVSWGPESEGLIREQAEGAGVHKGKGLRSPAGLCAAVLCGQWCKSVSSEIRSQRKVVILLSKSSICTLLAVRSNSNFSYLKQKIICYLPSVEGLDGTLELLDIGVTVVMGSASACISQGWHELAPSGIVLLEVGVDLPSKTTHWWWGSSLLKPYVHCGR